MNYLTEESALRDAQECADLDKETQYVYWSIYGCYWFFTSERKGSGPNVNYERVVTPA